MNVTDTEMIAISLTLLVFFGFWALVALRMIRKNSK